MVLGSQRSRENVERDREEKADDRERNQRTDEQQRQGRSPQIIFYITAGTPLVYSVKITLECNKANGINRISQVKARMEGWGSTRSFIYSNAPVC